MPTLNRLYRDKLSLLNDLYQLTMSYGYWKSGLFDQEAVFHLFYRKNPFGGNYAISCGLQLAIEYLQQFKFEREDIQYLMQLKGADGQTLFDESFTNYLQRLEFSCDIDAIREGTVIFPQEPIIRVKGPLLQAQLIETALLNIINYSTLVATKASRVVKAAAGANVLEFGLRRSHGIDGGLTASRSAYIGGCSATSNLLAGKYYDIPVKGTQAHSWIMAFDNEKNAFKAYADALPNNCVFLVDTYDTKSGILNAIECGKELRKNGHELLGIRLDSGDLAALSKMAREMLNQAGFTATKIVASNDLDENRIQDLKQRGAKIDIWGVGTRLATAYDDPALGGVYKLAGLKNDQGDWDYKIKLSEQALKTSNPGIQQVRRRYFQGKIIADILYDQDLLKDSTLQIDSFEKEFDREQDLLVSVFRKGELVYKSPAIADIREKVFKEMKGLDEGGINLIVEKELARVKEELIERPRV